MPKSFLKQPKFQTLRFGRYLPRGFVKANPFIGSWVSPNNLNFSNKQKGSDLKTLQGRIGKLHSNSFAQIISNALQSNWFYWQLKSSEQLNIYEPTQFPQDNIKNLILQFDSNLFKGKNKYRHLLTLCAITEYFNLVFNNKVRTIIIIFNYRLKTKHNIYSKFSVKYQSYYTTLSMTGLLGTLNKLDKVYRYL